MLVLSRRVGESIVIGDDIEIRIQRVSGKRVAVAIEAPVNVKILRGEIADDFAEPHVRDAKSAVLA